MLSSFLSLGKLVFFPCLWLGNNISVIVYLNRVEKYTYLLLNAYHMLDTILGTGNRKENKTGEFGSHGKERQYIQMCTNNRIKIK